ncbi:MAG: YciI family protein [Burkholderiales bacterium]|nr:YciI family protein [Burkholderiales bacterium]
MYFIILGTDKPGQEQMRAALRDRHRQHLGTAEEHGITLHHGGPTQSDDGQRMNGMLLIVEAENLELVQAFVREDPYSRDGLFSWVEIRPWTWITGRPNAVTLLP